ncbi:MAG: diguanylate cyclase [Oscillospiraceae bacterium]|nr:diguanylate cyclase [Oscillospiraceae bacterium]
MAALFGCGSMEEFREHTGNSFRGMVHPEDLERVESTILAQTFNSGRRHDYVRYRIVTKQGEERYVEDFGHLLTGGDGQYYYYVFIVDVRQEEYEDADVRSYAEMEIFRSNYKVDRLTGLLNMEAFYDSARETLLDRAAEGAVPSVIAVFDILGLREINRTLGNAEGDGRIRALAELVRAHMPQGTVVFRGHEAELVAVCKNREEQAVIQAVAEMVQTCKSTVLFGIGSSGSAASPAGGERGTVLQALEEARLDLRIKKLLNAKSYRSQTLTSLVKALEEADAAGGVHGGGPAVVFEGDVRQVRAGKGGGPHRVPEHRAGRGRQNQLERALLRHLERGAEVHQLLQRPGLPDRLPPGESGAFPGQHLFHPVQPREAAPAQRRRPRRGGGAGERGGSAPGGRQQPGGGERGRPRRPLSGAPRQPDQRAERGLLL